ncbi:MAG: universal stress protein [Ferruginibacter sp.]|nr:universal stress protein [Ferruginibacter sp.]
MKKILVTTDFSDKSKAGLFFAIQLASQSKYALTFFHAYHILTPTGWNVLKIEQYEKEQSKIIQEKLTRFVESIYADLGITAAKIKCIIKSSVFPESCIMEYAAENKFNFICISTRGAGKLQRILGTNTANLINQSDVPVIAVPFNYTSTKITSILYASDLINLEKELKNVVAFAKPLNSTIELLHLVSPLETIIAPKIIETAVKRFSKFDIKLNIKNKDFVKSMIANIETVISETKPSMMIMFTEQNRTLFQKIFMSSKSAEYSFNARIPLLVFNKS